MAKVLFFGATADIAGTRQVDRPAVDTDCLLAELIEEFPHLASQRLLVSVNQEYASSTIPLEDEDEVAIFTAVSGG